MATNDPFAPLGPLAPLDNPVVNGQDAFRRLADIEQQITPQVVRIDPDVADQFADPFTTVIPSALQQATREQDKENRSGLMKALHFMAEMTGIPSIFRVAITALPGQLEDPIRERTGIGRATGGDVLVAGITVLGGVGVRGALKLISSAVGHAVEPLAAASPAAVRRVMKALREGRASLAPVAGEATVPGRLTMPEMQRAVNVVIEATKAGEPISLDPAVGRLFKQIGRAYEVGDVEVDIIPRLMYELGIDATPDGRIAFARMFEDAFSEWGRTGKVISDLRKQLGKVLTRKELDAVGLTDVAAAGTVYRVMRGAVNLWRASITAQLSTAMRNLEVGLVRMPLKFFEDVSSAAVAKFTGQTGGHASFAPALENLTATWRNFGFGKAARANRNKIKKLLQVVDESENKLGPGSLWGKFFQTPATEITGTGLKGGARAWTNFWQMANRTQENMMRSIAFDAQLSKRMLQQGIPMEEVFALGPANWIRARAMTEMERRVTREMTQEQVQRIWSTAYNRAAGHWKPIRRAIEESVNEALEVTFALRPNGKLWNHLFKVYEEFPLAATIHPFPRFFANSYKFLKDHSPFGLMRFASQGQREAITRAMTAKGMGGFVQREATEALGKVMSGHMMLSAGLAFRNTGLAGDKWYEIRLPSGKTIDARPFNPLAAYMLLAEAISQHADPESVRAPLKTRDFAEAFAGIRRFTGTGLFVFNLFDSDLPSFQRGVQRTAAELVGGFTIPFRTIKDVLATAKPDEAVFRGKDAAGILGPAIANLPFAGALLPEEPRETRAGAVGEEPRIGIPGVGPRFLAPATARQLSGLAPRERTAVESELIRHDISARSRTGDPDLDRQIAEAIGPDVDRRLSRIINSSSYKRMNSVDQRDRLSKELTRLRSRAKSQILRRDRTEIVGRIMDELQGMEHDKQLRELRRMRNSGRINAQMERTIAARLRRAR